MTIPESVYNPNIPQPKDNLAQSQIGFLNNFGDLYNAFAANHVPLDALSEAGNHTIIQLAEMSNDPQTDLNEISVYTKNVAGQTDQIFLRYQGNGQVIQLSNYQIYSLGVAPSQTQYFTFLPGKIIVYFGIVTPSKLPSGIPAALYFSPQVAKNIITVNLCPLGTTALTTPWFNLEAAQPNGIIRAAFLFNLVANASYFYFAMANI